MADSLLVLALIQYKLDLGVPYPAVAQEASVHISTHITAYEKVLQKGVNYISGRSIVCS
jgi:hypothetical protein